MAVSHEYMLQVNRALKEALVSLGRTQNNIALAIETDTMIGAGDTNSTTWTDLQSSISTCIDDVNRAISSVFYSPEQEQ